jgi:hypothetical protein
MSKPTVVLERHPYRYVTCVELEINGKLDCRIQKFNEWSKRYSDMYYCDNKIQLLLAIEDYEFSYYDLD